MCGQLGGLAYAPFSLNGGAVLAEIHYPLTSRTLYLNISFNLITFLSRMFSVVSTPMAFHTQRSTSQTFRSINELKVFVKIFLGPEKKRRCVSSLTGEKKQMERSSRYDGDGKGHGRGATTSRGGRDAASDFSIFIRILMLQTMLSQLVAAGFGRAVTQRVVAVVVEMKFVEVMAVVVVVMLVGDRVMRDVNVVDPGGGTGRVSVAVKLSDEVGNDEHAVVHAVYVCPAPPPAVEIPVTDIQFPVSCVYVSVAVEIPPRSSPQPVET
ncbi:hypothetical protein BDZ45DRAFT_687718 [Acephala macrosclerotiorum]|nr:hypothetical protein BDZ45DRAFT_687718 [Acephala macrosclerotiorum]